MVELTYPRAVAETRLTKRNPADVLDRLRIFDQTPALPAAVAGLSMDTSRTSPKDVARRILGSAYAWARPTV